ncbi:MAG: hypothetical protein Q9207_004612 [Kuettlingeria erythrocarpa]
MAEKAQEKLAQDKTIVTHQVSSSLDIEEGSALAINASGHLQETWRHFSLLSLLAVGVVNNNCWTNLAGSLVVAISNGGLTSTLSFLAAILPHLLSGRKSVEPGPFWMGGWLGWVVNAASRGYIVVFAVIFCFPFSMPVDASNMNYASLMIGGMSLFVATWWFVKKGQYKGPHFVPRDSDLLARDAI